MSEQEAKSAADREIVSARNFDATRERVFEAWRDPERLAVWWGPKGFSNSFEQFEFRPGGTWRFVIHGPDGTDYPNESVFEEILEPERIVFRHASAPQFRMTVALTEQGGGTRLEWRMLFESAEDCAWVKSFAVEANEQNFDRLAAQLAGGPS